MQDPVRFCVLGVFQWGYTYGLENSAIKFCITSEGEAGAS